MLVSMRILASWAVLMAVKQAVVDSGGGEWLAAV
jgi:hypothetical protein